jgi:stearoyl-CoA desaturase (delta-9 desaturase)
MMQRNWNEINWLTSIFLAATLLLTLTAVPVYLWHFGLDIFQVVLFCFFFCATGLSITLGYHRLYSHLTFQAAWPVRLFTLLFGAAAFEHSVLTWVSDHRRHHKFVDQDSDPYDISKGFFYAHIGWLLFKEKPQIQCDNVKDLQRDSLVQWQHHHYYLIAFGMGLVLPTLLGWLWGGPLAALGSFLLAGIARTTLVQHMTFCINSLCHSIGRQPYSHQSSARDSSLMALFTFGEGYHNFHHTFQHDYRNGVKPWQFDPTKWMIWCLHRLGLVNRLRRIPAEKILQTEIAEKEQRVTAQFDWHGISLSDPICQLWQSAQQRLREALQMWEQHKETYLQFKENPRAFSRAKQLQLRRQFKCAKENFRQAVHHWRLTHRLVQAQLA